ncbi:ureidoglycolate hydrolase [Aspergillus pseudoustus]|uniref:Ureidoglycolate hydrolase n=1 Tax=Aspergillus pseudoustus TaxID=1810923 RepID=A0ABR4KPQ8_9EURO
MPPPTLRSSPSLSLTPEPLTRDSFAPFGTAIIPPLPRTVTSVPDPLSRHPKHPLVPEPVAANQLSALKYSPISPLLDNYPGKCPSGKASEARMTMFSSFPRRLRSATSTQGGNETALFDVTILERHPYTTQTFSPLALSPDEEAFYLVIVAPTLTGQTATAKSDSGEEVTIRDPPDLSRIRVFKARGDQALTYGAGTWHAPMVVVGKRRVDFVVVQFANGVGEEDCQEVCFPEGLVVEVGEKQGVKSRL